MRRTRELGMARTSDLEILAHAAAENRIVVSQDMDFGTLLALSPHLGPSVILFRRMVDASARSLLGMLAANLDTIEPELVAGSVVVIEPHRIRVRRLPIGQPHEPPV
jgi:predicted nuclease of predicted toxin-antitoxin system